jgi:hypothetical protein
MEMATSGAIALGALSIGPSVEGLNWNWTRILQRAEVFLCAG